MAVEAYRNRFIEAMDDDFNTAQAVACLFDIAREINRAEEAGYNAEEARDALKELAGVLGLTLKSIEAEPLDTEQVSQVAASVYKELGRNSSVGEDAEKVVAGLIVLRNELRKARQFQQADLIRNRLGEVGIILEDTPQGTVWKRKR